MNDGPHSGRPRPLGRIAGSVLAAVLVIPVITTGPVVAAEDPKPAVRLTPAAKRVAGLADPRIENPSGIAVSLRHPEVLWVLSGRNLFAVNESGATVGRYTLDGPPAYQLRAMAIRKEDDGRSTLLLGDFGDSKKRRRGIWLYSVAEPTTLGTGSLQPVRHRLVYPDGAHDAGTLLVDPYDQRAYVVTVSGTGGKLYAVPSVLGQGMGNKLAMVRPVYFVTQDGMILPDGRVVLRGRLQAHVLDGVKGARLAFVQLPKQTEYGPVTISADGKSIITIGKSRGSGVWRVAMPAEPGPSFTRGGETATHVPETKVGSPSRLPGGLLGTVSLVALAGIGGICGVLWLRRRRVPSKPA